MTDTRSGRRARSPSREARRLSATLTALVVIASGCSSDDLTTGSTSERERDRTTLSDRTRPPTSADDDSMVTSPPVAPTAPDTVAPTTPPTTPPTVAPTTNPPPTVVCPMPDTLRGRLSELLMVSLAPGDPAGGVALLMANPHLGGAFIGGSNDALLTDPEFQQTARNGPWLVAVDEEGGRVQRIDKLFGPMPSAAEQASTLTARQITDLASGRGALLRQLGVNVDFAPVVDLSDPTPGLIIGDRSYSSSATAVVGDAGAFAEGLRSAGVLPTLKHFPGHGRASGDSHAGPVLTPTLDDLRSSDLDPYRKLSAVTPTAVMVGHLDVPGLTEAGVPSSLSPATYRLLRDEIGFTGLVFTDELTDMGAVSSRFDATAAVVRAIIAGADVALVADRDVKKYVTALERAAKDGRLSTERINTSVLRVLATKQALGLKGCS